MAVCLGNCRQDLALVALYNSTREPPEGFEKWIAYAKKNECHLGPYTRIERDLQVGSTARDILMTSMPLTRWAHYLMLLYV